MTSVDARDLALLEEYRDWYPAQTYRDTSVEAFLVERETNRLAHNAEAVLLFLDDLGKENFDIAAEGIVNTVRYLLDAEVGDPEVEEWFEDGAEEVTVSTYGLSGEVINEVTSKVTVQSYNSEEGYYEDEEPR